jgi:hypothetical protein|nr:MAG TPA: hypothetical protein [Caudoviricetes sp.]
MKTTKYNALEELHNELNRGTPGDEVSLNVAGKEVLKIKFQTGGTATTERNGVFIEDLLIVAYSKLADYNRGLPCRENSLALTKIEEAIMWLANRKVERESRGVYGTEEK